MHSLPTLDPYVFLPFEIQHQSEVFPKVDFQIKNGGLEQCEIVKGGGALHLQTEVVKMALTLVLLAKLSDFHLFGLFEVVK